MSKGLRRSRAVPSRSQMSSMSARNASGTCLPTATVEVDLGERSYPLEDWFGLLDSGKLLRQHIPGVTALVVTNDTIAPHYLDRVVAALSGDGDIRVEVVVLPDGSSIDDGGSPCMFLKQSSWWLDRQTTFVALEVE